jgi:hypothetical protein
MDKRRYRVAGQPRRNQKMLAATLYDKQQCSAVPRPVSTREHISSAADSLVSSSILFRTSRSNPFLSRPPDIPVLLSRKETNVPMDPSLLLLPNRHANAFTAPPSHGSQTPRRFGLPIAVSCPATATAVLGCLCLEKIRMSDGGKFVDGRHRASSGGSSCVTTIYPMA